VVDESSQKTVNSIAQGDKIESITIEGDTTDLFAAQADRISEWNAMLDRQK
jgi:peptidyl-prolyl cis-trans isomerase B (cyclophilin B)